MAANNNGLKGGEAQAKTLTLLALWDLGGAKAEVKKSELTKRVTRTKEKAKDYQGVFEELEEIGAIAIATKNRVAKISLTDKGLQILGDGLKSNDLQFEGNQIGTRVANALVKWIRQLDSLGTSQTSAENKSSQRNREAMGKTSQKAIATYDEFKSRVLEVYDKLNYEYNFNHLVPIYRIRRQIGEAVNRTQFNDWLLEMQADDILQLQGGSVEDSAPDKIEDSISTVLDGLRCYAKLLKA